MDAAKVDAAPPDDFDRRGMIAHLATDVLLPMQANVAAKVALVPSAITAYCNALDSGTVGTTLADARAAFGGAIDAWERAEAVMVGPAIMDNETLRGRIYSWPLISPCELDRDTVTRHANPSSYDISSELVNTRSLSAVEFLLYPRNDLHNCSSEPPGWSALGAELPKARCRLAEVLAVDAAANAQALYTAWKADGGNYVDQLAAAGTSGSEIATAHAGANLLSDGLFYADKMVKDMKLGQTTGITINACQVIEEPCEREVELVYSDRATFAIRANLVATRDVFTGMTGLGFDDFLTALGHADVAARMTASLEDAIAKATALPDSFLGALSTDYARVVATHAATKAFTDDLKSQFLTLLALEIPDDVATDND